jgi:hypothetical protein
VKRTLILSAFLFFAGTAHAQMGGTLNYSNGLNASGGIGGAGALNQAHPNMGGGSAAPTESVSGTNSGPYVPSTYESYNDVICEAKEDAKKKPVTLADIARQAQADKKAAEPKSAVLLEQDSDGKLVIANPTKK